ncbi:MAG: hypothetical protein PHY15_08550 [Eubacteriales bacterium]|nr:hypothetical protein [Eubacteriales bacterium]
MSKYKVYEFSYKGEWLGGVILIISTSEEDALSVAKAKLLKQGRKDSLKFEKTSDITNGAIIYNDNGDY